MGFRNRTILYNRLIESITRIEDLIGLMRSDLDDALKNTDSNFPNKIESLEDKIKKVQLIENQFTELTIELYNFEP